MKYATIKEYDIANGPGVRLSLFVSGCNHHCPECFNEVAWSFDYGNEFTKEIEDEILDKVGNDFYKGLSLLGGEPLDPRNQEGLLSLVKRFKEKYIDKTVWCYTGYTWESIPGNKEILKYIDVLVDGPFLIDKKDIRLIFRGSSNQRIIDVQKSLKENKIVVIDPNIWS